MKKVFEEPKAEVIELSTADIVCAASGCGQVACGYETLPTPAR